MHVYVPMCTCTQMCKPHICGHVYLPIKKKQKCIEQNDSPLSLCQLMNTKVIHFIIQLPQQSLSGCLLNAVHCSRLGDNNIDKAIVFKVFSLSQRRQNKQIERSKVTSISQRRPMREWERGIHCVQVFIGISGLFLYASFAHLC